MTTQEQIDALANRLRPALPTEDVDISFIVHAAQREFASSPVEIEDLVIATVRALLESGEVVDAEMTAKGYVPRGVPPSETVQRIRSLWDERGQPPTIADMIWLVSPEVMDLSGRS